MKAKRPSKLKRARTERAKPRSVQRVVRERERKAFDAGWKAGQDYVNDHMHGYAHLSVPNYAAWSHYRRRAPLSNAALSETVITETIMYKITVAREAILQDLRRRWKTGPTPEHGVTAPADISRFHQPQTNYFCGAGVMDCPLCRTGKLKYSRSTYNGHVHARCSTDGCVAWQE